VVTSGERAISYGAALNTSGTCASLYFGARDFLKLGTLRPKAVLDGDEAHEHLLQIQDAIKAGNAVEQLLTPAELKKVYFMYSHSPKAQDAINRATFGVIMADMETAWKYLGKDKVPEKAELQKMVKEVIVNDGTIASREACAARMLAKITLEHDQVSRMLLQLHAHTRAKPLMAEKISAMDADAVREELLTLLPRALSSQLELSRENIAEPRSFLASKFREFLEKGKENEAQAVAMKDEGKTNTEINSVLPKVEVKRDVANQDYRDVYHAVGTAMEFFEHAPRAYTSPQWALGLENIQSMQHFGMSA
jgi:hypothetical protein